MRCRPARWCRAGLYGLALLACPLQAAVITVGPQESVRRIADAARLAKDGDTVLIQPGTYRGDVTVWLQQALEIRGIGPRPVLIADGESDDGTRERLQERCAHDARLVLVDNPGRIVSTGINACIARAQGEVVARLDIHTQFAPDYLARCIDTRSILPVASFTPMMRGSLASCPMVSGVMSTTERPGML